MRCPLTLSIHHPDLLTECYQLGSIYNCWDLPRALQRLPSSYQCTRLLQLVHPAFRVTCSRPHFRRNPNQRRYVPIPFSNKLLQLSRNAGRRSAHTRGYAASSNLFDKISLSSVSRMNLLCKFMRSMLG